MKKIMSIATEHSKIIFAAVLLLTLPLAHFYGQQRTHNTIEVFFEKDNADLAFYQGFRDTFGNEERSLIILRDENIFTVENISLVRSLSEMALRTPGVRRVISLTEQNVPKGEDGGVIFSPLVPEGNLSQKDLEGIRRDAGNTELINDLVLVSPDSTMTAIIMEFDPFDSNEEKGALQNQLMQAARDIVNDPGKLLFTGTPIIENELNTLGNQDNQKFGPLTLLMVLLIVALTLRSPSLSALCFFNVVFVSIWSIGFFVMMGETLNLVTMMIPPVLISIAVADSVHLLSHYKKLSQSGPGSRYEHMRRAIELLWLPCLLTTVTTAIGFLSFLSSPVRPVIMVGIYLAVGVFIAYLLTFTFIPAGVTLFGKHRPSGKQAQEVSQESKVDFLDRFLLRLTHLVVDHYKLVAIGIAFVFILTFIGASKIKYVTNFTNYMPDDNAIKTDMNYIDENYGGTVPIEIIIRANSAERDFTHPESLKMLDTVQNAIAGHMKGDYTSSFSIANYFKSINKAFDDGDNRSYRIPDDRLDVLDFYEIGEPDEIYRFISNDKREARISFQCINGPFDINVKLENFIGEFLPQVLGGDFSHKVTGYGRLYVDMDKNLKVSQIKSLSLAFLLVFAVMFFIARNFKLAILTMIPNLFPVGTILGLMGWFNIPFDVATIMVATMTLGIAVDDTIHYIVWYRRNIESGQKIEDALLSTVRNTGRPIVVTSLILFFGFSVMIAAQTLPLQFFGILTALSMLFAVVGDLVILPVLILLFRPAAVRRVGINAEAEAA